MSENAGEDYLRTGLLRRIAHEVRGPAGNIQLALHELELALGEEAARYELLLSKARRGILRVLRVADRLTRTAELTGGTAQHNAGPHDLVKLVRGAVASTEAIEARRNITIAVEAPEAAPWQLDATWMTAALSELASNAIRYAKRRVEVRVEVSEREARVTFADDNDAAVDFAPLRFEPPRERRGVGLGLALAEDVILAHGGRLDICIDATESMRTRVSVTLPREPGGGRTSISGGGMHHEDPGSR